MNAQSMLIRILEVIKKYQRPVRCVLWVFLIAFAFILCLVSDKPCNDGFVTESIILGMFADMGIYSFLRTKEKGNEK